jgi:hypothetical protein
MDDLLILVDELHQLAQSEPAPETETEGQGPDGDRWLFRSALQKAVRRGQTRVALTMSDRLRGEDPDSLWRSLAVIAVEDVGFGDPDAVTFTTAAISKTVRKRVGDDHGLSRSLVRRMCAAPKSRACCELSITVDMGRPDLISVMAQRTDAELIAALEERNSGTLYTALGLIRGRFPGYTARGAVAHAEAEEMISGRLGQDPAAARAAIHAFRRPVDTMSFAVLPTTRLMLDQPDMELVDEQARWPQSTDIMGFPAETFDIHTRMGGLALKALYTSLCRGHPWLTAIHPQRAARALGSAVFLEEGGLVDRRLTSPALSILQECQDRALMTAYGVPEALHERVRGLVRANLPRLHAKRAWACALQYPGVGFVMP